MKTLTNAAKVSRANQSVKERVQTVLGWSDLKYGEFQADMGYRYLVTEFGANNEMIDALIREKIFWSWWINHWVRRDQSFLSQYEGTYRNDLDLVYQLRHNPEAVVFKPQSTLLKHSYAKMMGKLIDHVNND